MAASIARWMAVVSSAVPSPRAPKAFTLYLIGVKGMANLPSAWVQQRVKKWLWGLQAAGA